MLLSDTRMDYDPVNRVTNTVQNWFVAGAGPVGGGTVSTRQTYNGLSGELTSTDNNGHQTLTVYESANRVAQITDALGNTRVMAYDRNGNVAKVTSLEHSDLGGAVESFSVTNVYDNLDRLVRTVDNIGNTNAYVYDSRGNNIRAIDARGNVVRAEFDGLKRKVRGVYELRAGGTGSGALIATLTNSIAWDDSSRVVAQTDGMGNITRRTYDALGRCSAIKYADGTTETMGFDVHDNVVNSHDANGNVIATTFDLLSRPTRMDVTPGAGVASDTTFEEYEYDGLSRIIRARDNDSEVGRSYDSLSRVVKETLNGQTMRQTFDGVGNRLTCVYPGGRAVTNTYDALNRIKTVRDGGLIVSNDFIGVARARKTFGNNTRLTYTYDTAPRIVASAHVRDPNGAAAPLDGRTYAWDGNHNKTRRTDLLAGATNSYQYDSIDRLTQSDATVGGAIQYQLDAAGNRKAVAGGTRPGPYVLDATQPAPADAQLNQYTSTAFDTRNYDAKGNLTSINNGQPDARLFFYDFRDRLTRCEQPGSVITFAYDAYGRRTAKVVASASPDTVLYFYDSNQRVIEERSSNQTTRATYVYGGGVDERLTMTRGGVTYTYHEDEQGNVVKISDATGAVTEQYRYGDFGETEIRSGSGALRSASAIGNPYTFTGREYDQETGLFNYRSRYFDPLAGRFISRDSIGLWGDPANMGNGYAYVGNNPWTGVDPDGRFGALLSSMGRAAMSPGGRKAIGATFSAAGAWWTWGEVTRSQRCWEPFRWNYAAGKAAVALAPLYLVFSKGKAHMPPGPMAETIIAGELRGARLQHGTPWRGGTIAEAFDHHIIVPPRDVEELLHACQGFHPDVDEMIKAVREGRLNLAYHETTDSFEFAMRNTSGRKVTEDEIAGLKGFFDPKSTREAGGTIHVRKDMPDVLRSTFAHEGDHGMRWLNGEASAAYKTSNEIMTEEVAAHTRQYQMEIAMGIRSEMPAFGERVEHVSVLYRNSLDNAKTVVPIRR